MNLMIRQIRLFTYEAILQFSLTKMSPFLPSVYTKLSHRPLFVFMRQNQNKHSLFSHRTKHLCFG